MKRTTNAEHDAIPDVTEATKGALAAAGVSGMSSRRSAVLLIQRGFTTESLSV
jgi:hypothetical protein